MLAVIDGKNIYPDHGVWARLEKDYDLVYLNGDDYTDDELIDKLKDCQIILNGSRYLSRDVLEALGKLRYIGILATGFNIVDLGAAGDLGIAVTNVPAYSTQAVAQYTLAMVLYIVTNLGFYTQEVAKGAWPKGPDFYDGAYPIIELRGKTLGIMGYGDIGRKVADLARAFGMEILAYNRSEVEGVRQVSREELFSQADIISLHLPLNDETREIINKEALDKMKDGVILINTARGGLINEKDLAQALDSGKVYRAGLDVVSQEPIRKDNPLLSCKNVYLSPHIAWASQGARYDLVQIAYDNLQSYLGGGMANRL